MSLKGIFCCKGLFLAIAGFLIFGCKSGGVKKVYFANLEDGSSIQSPFKVVMKAENLIVEPAALGVNEGHGHYHILVDVPLSSTSQPIPKDAQHIHYGNGETEATLNLPVGPHTLILQFAKGDHVPYDPPVFQQIKIDVTRQNGVDSLQNKASDTSAVQIPANSSEPGTEKNPTSSKADSTAKKD